MKLGKTESVCPVCLRRIPAERVARGGDVFLEKSCPEHGAFSVIVWRGGLGEEFDKWRSYTPPDGDNGSKCPTGCGLCAGHLNKTCCALVEITRRCNLRCPVCFANGGTDAPEPSVAELYKIFKKLAAAGNTFVQLSGGEPTVRDDLPEIVAAARRAGCDTVQLNSNGIRLGSDPDFTAALADAGLSFVFMQFDGMSDNSYIYLRDSQLITEKIKAIDICSRFNLGVTLVPTLVPRVNIKEIGDIIDFAVSRSPAVRGVHFQPVSYFGRYPFPPADDDRITLPEVLQQIEIQTGGKFKLRDFNPSSCDHPCCGFHGDFVVLPRGRIMKLTKKYNPDACCADDSHLKNRAFVARRWTRPANDTSAAAPTDEKSDYRDMSTFLSRVKSHGFTISAMAFQDAWTLDLERLRRCSLHVSDGARVVPFCARYVTGSAPIQL
ncbi:MAG: radical SAM protein [Oscillospiraceae bacterium]|jgi:uncharacterized radical SAM superfamily Fe-S cluster-containing enzyme|nr:radical SAM protein [Oscillospiraceae bacterium]